MDKFGSLSIQILGNFFFSGLIKADFKLF